MIAQTLPQKTGLLALHLLALFLFVAPRVGVKLGPAPLYAVDLLAATALLAALLTPRQQGQTALPAILLALMVFVVLGETFGGVSAGRVLEPIYAAGRLVLALSLAYAVAVLVRGTKDVAPLLKAATIGILATSALMILSSLPATRAAVAGLFAHPFLEPAAARTLEELHTDDLLRGRSLIGVSIVSATVLNVALPFAGVLAGMSRGVWRLLALLALMAGPVGVAMSYSRSAYVGLLLVAVGMLAWRVSGRRTVLITLCAGGIAVGVAGTDTLLFSRLETRVSAMVTAPLADEREWERLLAYAEPFLHAVHHPRFLLIGEGSVAERFGPAHQSGKATHAVFAKAFYGFGLLAAVLFAALPFVLLSRLWRVRRTPFGGALFVATLPLVPYFLFDHGAISAPASLMLVGLLFGLSPLRSSA